MPIVSAERITRVYGEGSTAVHALRSVDLSIEAGEFVAIMGPSGSGKSTLLAILGGLESVSTGEVRLKHRPLAGLSETDLSLLRREQVGFVFQSFNLLPVLTAEENVALPLLLAEVKEDEAYRRVERVINLVGLADRATHLASELSGGQQQRVAIARALVTEPALLLADEPTGNLDSRTGTEVMALFRRCCDDLGQTVVLVTHDPAIAAWADRVIILRDGSLASDGSVEGGMPERTQAIRARLEEVIACG